MDPTSKMAVVTGAGSGIGRPAAIAFLKKGWSVALAGRRRDPLEATANDAGSDRARPLVVPTDVTYPESVHTLLAEAKKAFGRTDLLFNKAGIFGPLRTV